MQRPTVLLLFGGESSEHDVSISSARNVYAAIDNTKYQVELGFIDRQGKWWLIDKFGQEVTSRDAAQLAPVLGTASFVTFPSSRVIMPDVILPILHGKNGEDGAVQGLAQLLHIPVVGCDMTASAICMDKVATKEILSSSGIKIVPYEVHHKMQELPDFSKLNMTLGCPLFVKPSRSGSSVGVSKVHTEDELIQALETAHRHDEVALIERGITAREIEVAIIGNPPYHEASVAGEIQPDGEFYSYDSKYAGSSESKVIIPADLTDDQHKTIQNLALRIYELLGCKGLARVDFFLTPEGEIFLNEINTIPGFTNISMYPKLWQASGLTYPQLIEKLIHLALDIPSST
ncbi:MAG: D-alanine--D-alanine ligase family protein [Candidatus Saccharimonadales bacterium]